MALCYAVYNDIYVEKTKTAKLVSSCVMHAQVRYVIGKQDVIHFYDNVPIACLESNVFIVPRGKQLPVLEDYKS